jgi:hypothetical protein
VTENTLAGTSRSLHSQIFVYVACAMCIRGLSMLALQPFYAIHYARIVRIQENLVKYALRRHGLDTIIQS